MAKRIAINPYAQPRAHRGMFGKKVNLKEWMECMFLFLFMFPSFYICGLQWMVNFLEVHIHTRYIPHLRKVPHLYFTKA